MEVFTALSETVETGMQRVSFDVISTLHSQRSTLIPLSPSDQIKKPHCLWDGLIRKFFDCKEWCSPFEGCTISFSQAESLYFCGFSRISSISFWSSFSSGMVNRPIAVK